MHPQPHTPPLQYGSVCSGIEAVSLAWQPLGLEPAWFAEIEPFPCAVLAHHYPDVPNLGDMQQIAARYSPAPYRHRTSWSVEPRANRSASPVPAMDWTIRAEP